MPITYPAQERHSRTALLHMERGDYRRSGGLGWPVLWHFCLPDADRTIEIKDSLVQTIKGKPVVTIGPWTLDKGEDGRMVWTRMEAK